MKHRICLALLFVSLLLVGCRGGAGSDKPGGQNASSGGQGSKTNGSDSMANGADTSGKANNEASIPVDVVRIPEADQGRAGIQVAQVQVRSVARQLAVAGQVTMDGKHTEHVGAIAEGPVEQVLVLPGDHVHAGQTLALMHSHAVHETAGALAQAYAAVTRQTSAVRFAELNRERYQHLLSLQVASEEEAQRADQGLRQAQQDLTDAQANVHMEREHLSELLQVSPDSLTPNNLYTHELIPIRAVSGGTVIQRDVTPGQVLNIGDQAFVVSKLSTVWVTAAVNEADLSLVHRGASADVTTQGYPDSTFHATVAMLGDQLDPQTRTVPVRLSVPNPGTRLRPGMFITASIDEPSTHTGVFVPTGAVQDVNGLQVVFVARDGETFQVRAVKLGTQARGMVEVTDGLKPGDRVVVGGAFMVKAALLKSSVGEG